MQEVKCFFQGTKDGQTHLDYVEDQINEFLKTHPTYTARSISMMLSDRYLDAYVIFDVREENLEKKNKPKTDVTSFNTKDYINKNQKVTAINGK